MEKEKLFFIRSIQEGEQWQLYPPASRGAPLAGKLPYGSADDGNLRDEMLRSAACVYLISDFIHPFTRQQFIEYLLYINSKSKNKLKVWVDWDTQMNPDMYFRVEQPIRIFPSQIITLNSIEAKLKCPGNVFPCPNRTGSRGRGSKLQVE